MPSCPWWLIVVSMTTSITHHDNRRRAVIATLFVSAALAFTSLSHGHAERVVTDPTIVEQSGPQSSLDTLAALAHRQQGETI